MVKTRIILVVACAVVIWLIFLLPKAVVENESQLATAADTVKTTEMPANTHVAVSESLAKNIKALRNKYFQSPQEQKSSIFADSLADLYKEAGQFDSAAWFAEKTASFFNNKQSYLKAGNSYYEAYTFAMEPQKQEALAVKAREYLGKVLELDPKNLESKAKIALTYFSSNPPQGVAMLREVIAEDPENEFALFNLGMLSIQSRQFANAVDRLEKLVAVNPNHLQGQLLLGVAYMNNNAREKAREQFEKVKKMDKDPSVQATVDSYLKDLK
jgi:cytochrome c-type biogenesis protein CcmH/NrfG